MLKKSLLLAALLVAFPAFAQNVQYVSPVTRNHIPVWNTNGVIADGGSSADSPITSIGVTNNGGAGFCVSSDRQTAAGRNQLCFGASTTGAATISLQNYGTAAGQGLNFVINGTTVSFPTGGGAFTLENPPFVAGHASCFLNTGGVLIDCGVSVVPGTQFGLSYYATASTQGSTGAGTNGQFLIGQTSAVPLWKTLSGDAGSVSTNGVLTLAAVNGIPFSATYTAHGVLLGEAASAFASTVTTNVGYCLLSQGLSSDPIWASCASGAGSAGGLTTQVQFNNSTSLAGSVNLTWATPTLTLGVAGTTTGQLGLASSTATGTVTLQAPGVASAYNFNFPTGAGSSGQPLISGGGGATPNTFGTLGIVGGGTNCASASGTCLDNITGFASNGFVQRTGAGTYALTSPIPVSNGGTNLASGTSGGILGYTATGTLASSALLAANGFVIGGGAGATPTALTACTNGQIPVGLTSGAPACQTLAGDITTVTSGGTVTIANSAITVAKQANATAWTMEGNFTSGSAAPQFSTIGALTAKASPAAGDLVMIQDITAGGQFKQATVSSIGSAGSVASIAGNTGAFTLTNGITNTSNAIGLVIPVISANGGTGVVSPAIHTIPINQGASAQNNSGTGTLGQALISQGASADPAFKSGALVLLNTLTASNSATLSDTTSLTSAFNEYDIVFENVIPATNAVSCEFQIHTAGGFISANYLANVMEFASSAVNSTAATSFIPCSQASTLSNIAAFGISGTYRIYNASSTTQTKYVAGQFSMYTGTLNVGGMVSGVWTGGVTAVDGFQVLMSAGNITSGTIKVYGKL